MLSYKELNDLPKEINITKSETADSRTCDFSLVTKDQLFRASKSHIGDVKKGLSYFANRLIDAGVRHDFDKLEDIDGFHDNFITNFKKDNWYKNHVKVNRHHLNNNDGVPKDVNLIDVMEMIVDCVMAGKARSGEVFDIKIPNTILQLALKNTVEELKGTVKVEGEH